MKATDWGLEFHHFGLAVRKIDTARPVLEGLGYECGEEMHDPLQNVLLAWCHHPSMPAVELVAPTSEPGPVDNLLARNGDLVYHLCYRTDSLDRSVDAIRRAGVRVLPVAEPKPAVLFGGRRVGFYQLRGFGLIEIVEGA